MKSTMPYAGVTVPEMRRLVRALAATHRQPSFAAWRDTVVTLWRGATVREERYAATALCDLGVYRDWAAQLDTLPVYREFIVSGAWWDHVDEVATHRIGALLRAQPAALTPVLLDWSGQEDRWLRRSAVICQVGLGRSTDEDLLRACLVANLDDRDFFLRKAIGWALRQHARVAPEWVLDFVRTHESRLSPLSRAQALKHLGPRGPRPLSPAPRPAPPGR